MGERRHSDCSQRKVRRAMSDRAPRQAHMWRALSPPRRGITPGEPLGLVIEPGTEGGGGHRTTRHPQGDSPPQPPPAAQRTSPAPHLGPAASPLEPSPGVALPPQPRRGPCGHRRQRNWTTSRVYPPTEAGKILCLGAFAVAGGDAVSTTSRQATPPTQSRTSNGALSSTGTPST